MPTVSELTVKIDADVSGVSKGVQQAEKEVGGFGDSINKGLGMGLGFGAVGAAIGLVGSAFSAAKGSIIDLNGSLEQSKIAFTTMLGSAENADKFLGDLQKFAAQTPFEFPDLVSASKRMLAFGFESKQVVPLLTAVGDAVAAVGGGAETIDGVTTAIGQMQAKGKVSAEEMGQLAERGIPAWDMLAKHMGVSVAEAMDQVSKGQVKAGTFVEAFQKGSAERFGGMMEKQSATWSGALSTISDSVTMATAKAFKPFFELISEGAIAVSKFVQSDMFNEWSDRVSRTIEIVANTFRSLFEIFTGEDVFIEAREALSTFFPANIADDIIFTVTALGDTFRAIFAGDIPEALFQAQEVLGNLGMLIVDSVESWAASFAGWVETAGPGMLSNLGDMALEMQDWLLETSLAIIEQLATWAAAFIDWIGPMIPPFLRELGGYLVKFVSWLVDDALPTIIGKLVQWGEAFVEWIGPRIGPMLLEAGKLLVELGGWIIGTALPAIITKLGEWGSAFFEWVPGAVVKLLYELGRLEVELLKWIVTTALPGIVSKLTEWGAAFIGWVAKDVLPELPGALLKIQLAIISWIAEKVGQLASKAGELGSGLVSGIRDGIAGALSGFWSWLQSNFVDKIPSFVRELLNIRSPSGVFADIGRQIVEGLRVGMESRMPSIDELISRMVGRIATAGEVTDWLKAAMHITGVGGDWLAGLQRLVHLESTGNPRAINPVSVGGQHATGLLQTLPSTFRSYALKGMRDIFNPIHNAVAAIRYIDDTYGHVNRIPGLYGNFKGYAEGGIAWTPQLAMVGEREPEAIIPKSWFGRNGGSGSPVETVRFVIQDPGGQTLADWYVTGREVAIRYGRATS